MANTFGNYIRKMREAQNLLQRQVAAALEIDTPMLSKIERGDRRAKRDQVARFAKTLGVKEKELLTLWLADKIYDVIKDEGDAIEAMRVAEEAYNYQKKKT
jgi:transcriptional regulator with XRE-family HTH domain